MKQSKSIFPTFFLCFLIVLFVMIFGRSGLFSWVQNAVVGLFTPFEKTFYHAVYAAKSSNDVILLDLQKKIASDALLKENSALADQFQTPYPKSTSLLPATVIGSPRFIPGLSAPEELIINVGTIDGVAVGQGVVVKDNVVGKIVSISKTLAKVGLVTHSGFSYLTKTRPQNRSEKEALGVVKGLGGGQMMLDNVVVSETIKSGDAVLTKGDTDENGHGFLPDLVIGKITSVDKKPSSLFQTAQVESLVDATRLSTVFVIK